MEPTAYALSLIRLYGPLALCLFTFLEASMLFPFLPSEVVVPAAAAVLVTGPASLVGFVAAAAVGGTVGAFVPYRVFHEARGGRLDRLAAHVRVSDRRIERGETLFRRWGGWLVLWGRFLPVLRSVVSIPAGLAKMSEARFGALTTVGTVGFYAAVGGAVYYGRTRSLYAAVYAAAVESPLPTAVVALSVVAASLLVGRWTERLEF